MKYFTLLSWPFLLFIYFMDFILLFDVFKLIANSI
jgi:hypothetical protein